MWYTSQLSLSNVCISTCQSPTEYDHNKVSYDYLEEPSYYHEKVPCFQSKISFENHGSKDYNSRYDQPSQCHGSTNQRSSSRDYEKHIQDTQWDIRNYTARPKARGHEKPVSMQAIINDSHDSKYKRHSPSLSGSRLISMTCEKLDNIYQQVERDVQDLCKTKLKKGSQSIQHDISATQKLDKSSHLAYDNSYLEIRH